MDREMVVRDAREIMCRFFPEWAGRSGGCLFLAASVMLSLSRRRVKALLQAGSCFWPRLTEEQAAIEVDPILSFGYEWEPHSEETRRNLIEGALPEMHVWAFIPDTQEIVDIASGEWPAQCLKIVGVDWPGPRPPAYFWCKIRSPEWPAGVRYVADWEAIRLADSCLSFVLGGR